MKTDFCAGDFVAILPCANSPPEECLEIACVRSVDLYAIRLSDGRAYCRHGLWAIGAESTYITEASEAHRFAVAERNRATKCA